MYIIYELLCATCCSKSAILIYTLSFLEGTVSFTLHVEQLDVKQTFKQTQVMGIAIAVTCSISFHLNQVNQRIPIIYESHVKVLQTDM